MSGLNIWIHAGTMWENTSMQNVFRRTFASLVFVAIQDLDDRGKSLCDSGPFPKKSLFIILSLFDE